MTERAPPPSASGATVTIDRWPTGAKLFLILSAALLPLAIIAVFATLQTTRTASAELRGRLRVAAAESTRALSIELVGDATALRAAADALARDPADAPSCARVQGVFAPQQAAGVGFVLLDARGQVQCGRSFPEAGAIAAAADADAPKTRLIPGALVVAVASSDRRVRAAALFPARFLAPLAQPSGFGTPYAATLLDGGGRLTLAEIDASSLERRETIRSAVGLGDLALEMQVRSLPISSSLVIALLLPLLMWAAAAGIAWLVVDRVLIRPLRELRASVAAFRPGLEIDTAAARAAPAQEIRELGDTFRAISRTVALHEAGLADGIARQTKLTREVHHRVKNNLQVIASLINFHARGATSEEATHAYASIQRRVDALAVVHRHHFAEAEDNQGLSARSMIGELSSNLRATAADGTALGIILDVEPLCLNQDVAVATAFLITEMIELGLAAAGEGRFRVSLTDTGDAGRARLRVSSPALVETTALRDELVARYGRVMEGLSRQLRAKLHHDPLAGAFEIEIAFLARS